MPCKGGGISMTNQFAHRLRFFPFLISSDTIFFLFFPGIATLLVVIIA